MSYAQNLRAIYRASAPHCPASVAGGYLSNHFGDADAAYAAALTAYEKNPTPFNVKVCDHLDICVKEKSKNEKALSNPPLPDLMRRVGQQPKRR